MAGRLVLWCRNLLYRPLIVKKTSVISNVHPLKIKRKYKKTKSDRDIPTVSPVSHHVFLRRLRFSELIRSSIVTMSLLPPETVKGMVTLNREKFCKTISVPCLSIPAEEISKICSVLKKYFIKLPKLSAFCDLEEDDPDKSTHRIVLFDPNKLQTADDFTENERKLLTSTGVNLESFRRYDLQLKYENWTAPEILQAIIPDDIDNISGFTLVGHIAHFNLRTEALPWKEIIGEVMLDKNPILKTVVNKTNQIDNTFRTFQMELLAGEDNFVTTVKENGFSFQFDFSKVYWNSRLGTEHQRIANLVSKGDVVYDVFAGVGPFAVPMSRRQATVLANDLNPFSYESLLTNVKLNKVKPITCYNLDGREFIRTVVKPDLLKGLKYCASSSRKMNCLVVMNLPALAIEFLDAFVGLFTSEDVDGQLIGNTVVIESLPKVHCYCFQTTDNMEREEVEEAVKNRVKAVVGNSIASDLNVRLVRKVAPSKDMMCASFSLTWKLLCDNKESSGEPAPKQRRLEESQLS